jgi:hypothetical protein
MTRLEISETRKVRVVGTRTTNVSPQKVRKTAGCVPSRPTRLSVSATASVQVSATRRRFSTTADNRHNPRECFPWYY